MSNCENCGKSNKEVLLCDVVSRMGIVKMCESCAKAEGLPVVRLPTESDAMDFVMSREPKPPKLQLSQSNMIENFHWDIQMARRRSKLTTKQLAIELKEPEEMLKTLEAGKILPRLESERIVNKMEQFFRIKLKKESDFIGSDLELAEDVFNDKV